MAYSTYTTVKLAKRDIPWGGSEYQVQELDGFALSDWVGLEAARRNADAVELQRTAPADQRGWGGLEQA